MKRVAIFAAILVVVTTTVTLGTTDSRAAEGAWSILPVHPAAVEQPTVRGRTIHTLEGFDGRLYPGFGDYNANTGPISVTAWDPVQADWIPEGVIGAEEVNVFKRVGDSLVAPIVDARGGVEGPEYAIRSAGVWTDREAAGGHLSHVFDFASSKTGRGFFLVGSDARAAFGTIGSASACGGPAGMALVGASELDGEWSCQLPTHLGALGHGYGLVEARGRLWYPDEARAASWVFEGSGWSPSPLSLGGPNIAYRDEAVGEEAVYLANPVLSRYDFPQTTGTLMRFDGLSNAMPIISGVVDLARGRDDSGREVVYALRRLPDGTLEFGEVDLDRIGPDDYVRIGDVPADGWSIGFLSGVVYIGAREASVYRWEGMLPGIAPALASVQFTEESARSGQYSDVVALEARLVDDEGNGITQAPLRFELHAKGSSDIFEGITNENGVARVDVELRSAPGFAEVEVSYSGNADKYSRSSTSCQFIIEKEDTRLEISLSDSQARRSMKVRLSDPDSDAAIAGRIVVFSIDGQRVGEATTDGNGKAVLDAPARYRGGHHDYAASFAGDDFYLPSDASKAT